MVPVRTAGEKGRRVSGKGKRRNEDHGERQPVTLD